MKNTSKKVLLSAVILSLVVAGLAPSLAAEAASKPKPVRLLVEWGNLDGYVSEQASKTVNYKGYIEAVTGNTQLRIVRAYPNDFREDSFVQRTGQRIEFSTKVHGHKDGLLISVGNYDPIKGARLQIVLDGGDAQGVFMYELRDLMSENSEFTVGLIGVTYEQSLRVRALNKVSFGLKPASELRVVNSTPQLSVVSKPSVKPVPYVKPVPQLTVVEPEEKPEPIYLLVRWGNLSGQPRANINPRTVSYDGDVEIVGRDSQITVARPYRFDWREDSFAQRTGQRISVWSEIHNHQDGLILKVRSSEDLENTHIIVSFNGDDVKVSIPMSLEEILGTGGFRKSVLVDGEDYGHELELKVLSY